MKNILFISALVFLMSLRAQEKKANSPWVVKTQEMISEFGETDERGATNILGPELVLSSLNLVKKGEVLSLAVDLDRNTPAYGWRRFELIVSQNEGTHHSNNEDVIFAPINTGTQIDGLAHMGVDGHFFNGHKGEDIQQVSGLKKLGVENVPPIVTRGILLDIASLKKTKRLPIGSVISVQDIKDALKRQGIEDIQKGDVVLFHTGHRTLLDQQKKELFLSGQPGPGIEATEYLASKGVIAIGGDSGSVEVIPFEKEGLLFPVHQLALAKHGIHLLENVATERLAQREWYEFLFIATPLPIVGSSSSWINPIAIK